MKNLYTLCLAVLLYLPGVTSFAQEILTGADAQRRIPNAEIVRTGNYGTAYSFIRFRPGSEPAYADFARQMNGLLKLGAGAEMILQSVNDDALGYSHYRFVQYFDGKPVEATAFYVHVKAGKVVSLNGFFHQTLERRATKPSISATQAIEAAIAYTGAKTYMWEVPAEEARLKYERNNPEATYYPSPVLVYASPIDDFSSDVYRLAYKMNVYAKEPLSHKTLYVDAATGEVFAGIEQLHDVDVPGTAHTGYSGQRTIMTTLDAGTNLYVLRETGRGNGIETYNLQTNTSYGSAVDFTDSDNVWNNINPQFDQYATDAHWGAEMTYDYLWNIHGRNSIDNNGFALYSYVHYSNGFFNAFWDGMRMTYGDGNGLPLTTVDICSHEVTHGLTQNTANLIYSEESGALNESFSDIFGVAVDRFARPNLWNWIIGEELGSPFRSMENPKQFGDPDTYFGQNWAPLSGGDNGGVHTNSGVQNFWFHILAEGDTGVNDLGNSYTVAGLGFNKAEKIAFRNLTVYLTPISGYADARFYSILSAVDLYTGCSYEVGQVTNAWYAVGVGSAYVPFTLADFNSSVSQSCSAPFTVSFNNLTVNGQTFVWDFGDGSTSTDVSPVHTYTAQGSYTVSLTAHGGQNCGTDDTVKVNYIKISDTLPCLVILPDTGVAPTQNGCSGTLYDNGGPDNNYSANSHSVITIAPSGASNIMLNFISFSIEPGTGSSCNYDYLTVYDGPSVTSPVIGVYCNNNLPPSSLTSSSGAVTIEFFSDQGVEDSGFEIEWLCNLSNHAPEANFIYDEGIACMGDISFIDQSQHLPTSWLWDFGDGTTSTLQNPVHHYSQSGTYTVSLTVTNSFGNDQLVKTDVIDIQYPVSSPMVINADTVCSGNPAVLVASSPNNIIMWYDSMTAVTGIHTGDTLVTPPLTMSTDYYADATSSSPALFAGPADNTFGSGGFFNGDQHLIFDVYNNLTIDSVTVYSSNSGTRIIELRDSLGNTLQSLTVLLTGGEERIALGFSVQPGNNYQLGTKAGSQPNLYRNNSGANYPYTINGLLSITGSSASISGYYYFFYNWQVREQDCRSERIVVTAPVEVCTGVEETPLQPLVSIYPNPANDRVNVSTGNGQGFAVELYNTVGKLVYRAYESSSRHEIGLSKYAPGVYLVKVIPAGSAPVVQRLIKK